jgi:type IV secretion system protein TrbB
VGFDLATITFRAEAFARGARMLRTALGAAIANYLEDPDIVEVMLNPDGRLWIDRLPGGLKDTGCLVMPADAERIVGLVANHVGIEVHAGSPRVLAELPEAGERFEGLVPPVVAAPCFAIHRSAVSPRLCRGRHHIRRARRAAAGSGPGTEEHSGRRWWDHRSAALYAGVREANR